MMRAPRTSVSSPVESLEVHTGAAQKLHLESAQRWPQQSPTPPSLSDAEILEASGKPTKKILPVVLHEAVAEQVAISRKVVPV